MKKIAIVMVLSGLLLAGCDSGQNTKQVSVEEAPSAEIAQAAPKPDHFYSMKDGQEYGYEKGISQDQQNAGQVAAALMMFKYAGQKDDLYQVYSTTPGGGAIVMQCSNPCDFIKTMAFFQGAFVSAERFKATDGALGWAVLTDAINGKLEQYVTEKHGKKAHIWFDEHKGLTNTPI
ncbi:MAG: hypothetical protein ACYCY1_12515 [Sulfuriferula sp.]